MIFHWITVAGQWFIPLFLLLVFSHAIYKKVPLFDTFVEGAKEGFSLAIRLLPYVVGVYVAVGIFRGSGALDVLLSPFEPVFAFLGVPEPVLPLMVVRFFSGPAALGLTADLIDKFGPDSFTGRLASTLDGSTDTVIYILAVYFASIGIRDARYALPVSIAAAISGYLGAVFICRVVFA